MATSFVFHLVDEDGDELHSEIVREIERMQARLDRDIVERFGEPMDPAVVSEAVEKAARNVQRDLERKRTTAALGACVRRGIWSSLIDEKRRQREYATDPATLEWRGRASLPDQYETVLLREIQEAVRALPHKERRVYEMHLSGVSTGRIAEMYGLTVGNADQIISRARKNIAERFRTRHTTTKDG